MRSDISLSKAFLAAALFCGVSQSQTPPPPASRIALVAVQSDQIFNVSPREHLAYDEILPPIQEKLYGALAARGFIIDPTSDRSVRLELLQVAQNLSFGGTVQVDLMLRISTDRTNLAKVFRASASRRKLTGINGKHWREFINQRLNEAAETLVQNIVGDPQFLKLAEDPR